VKLKHAWYYRAIQLIKMVFKKSKQMIVKMLLASVMLLSSSRLVFSQNVSEEEAVKNVIRFESESYMKDDSVAWKDQFVQDDKTSIVFTRFGFAQNHVGWDNFAP